MIEIPAAAEDAVVVAELVEDGTDAEHVEDEPEALESGAERPDDEAEDDAVHREDATWGEHRATEPVDEPEPATAAAQAPAESEEGSEEPAAPGEDFHGAAGDPDTAEKPEDTAGDPEDTAEDSDDTAGAPEDVRWPGSGIIDVQASQEEVVDVSPELEDAPADVAESEPSPARDADIADASEVPAFAPVLAVRTAPVPAVEEETVTHEPARTPDPEFVSRRRTSSPPRAGERRSAHPRPAHRERGRVPRPDPGAVEPFRLRRDRRSINLGDSARQGRKEQTARIARPRCPAPPVRAGAHPQGRRRQDHGDDAARHDPRDAREDRIIAIDANPDRGTLVRAGHQADPGHRAGRRHARQPIGGFTDFTTLVSRDETRLDILASDTDPLLSEAFDENDYNVVADLAARFYSIALTDCGTGIVHSVMRATLQRADSVVIVSGGSVDEARLASETLTWLEANGYGDLVQQRRRGDQHRDPRHVLVQARRDRVALRLSRPRHRADPVRPAARRRFGRRLQEPEADHEGRGAHARRARRRRACRAPRHG